MKLQRAAGLSIALVIALLGGFQTARAQGFGKVKRKVVLHRKLPPVVHLPGLNISVNVTSRDARAHDVVQQLRDSLETEILKYDNRLNADKARPDAVVSCSITGLLIPPPKMVVRTPMGINTRPQQYQEVSGLLQISYQTKAARTGRVLDSENVKAKFSGEYEMGGENGKGWDKTIKKGLSKIPLGKKHGDSEMEVAPTQEEVQQILVSRAVSQIAARVVKTDEPVQVLLARGKLDDSDKLAEAGLWPRMQQALETMQPLPTKEEDAYRLYNIGVVYEAEAYQAEDVKTARRFLEQAAIHYGKALDANPGEKYFLEPQNRIETALAHYKKIEATTPAGGKSASPTSSNEPLTNQQVIDLAKAGMDEPNLIEAVKTAPAVNFDFSVAGQLQLVKAGIKGRVLSAMRERAGMKSTSRSR